MRISEKKTYKVTLFTSDKQYLGSALLDYNHTLYGLINCAKKSVNRGNSAKYADVQCIDDDIIESYKITSSGDAKKL